jgi:glycosyltransferase involved in cell wall biosynthesis
MKPKQIFVNGRFLTQQQTGIQKFAIGICEELHRLGHSVNFICPKHLLKKPSFGKIIQTGKFSGHLWEQIDLPIYVLKNRISVLVNLGNSAPLLLKNNLVTIHDLAFLENPNWYTKSYRLLYAFLTPKIIRKAIKVFTVSENSKQQIVRTYQVESIKLEVLKQGVNFKISDKKNERIHPKKYFLYVGSIDPRKRISFLIKAFNKAQLTEYDLVLIGKKEQNF